MGVDVVLLLVMLVMGIGGLGLLGRGSGLGVLRYGDM